ncbi:hypothetical protein [Actinoplanes sp. NPDC051851]|uniref:hypothetical protein n=1 Tax=Actinoplanes sp. NPDC051851 TaxID=3154753 RepID=UPI00342606E7
MPSTRAAVRNLTASVFGLVGELPTEVTAGCGKRVPYAMTSTRPESVTCLACREHAHTQHLRFAEQIVTMGPTPGITIPATDIARAAAEHRAIARRFADPA